jgi:hypothetical protein
VRVKDRFIAWLEIRRKAPRRNKLGNLAAVAGCGARREEES